MNIRKAFAAIALVASATTMSGCIAGNHDRIMVSESYLGNNYIKNIVVKGAAAATDSGGIQLWNWVVRVCDIDENDGTGMDCVDTTIVDNVANYDEVR